MTTTAVGVALVFVVGYVCIATENLTRLAKPATALLMAVAGWTLCAIHARGGGGVAFPAEGAAAVAEAFGTTTADACSTILYLLAAMIIVGAVDGAGGFEVLVRCLKTSSRRRLMLCITAETFALSMVLDNVTTTIVMLAIVRRLVAAEKARRWFAAVIVVAANAGGAASPIGDVTTLLLWTSGKVDGGQFLTEILPAALVSVTVPLAVVCARVGKIKESEGARNDVGKFVAHARVESLPKNKSMVAENTCGSAAMRTSTQSVGVALLALASFAAIPFFVRQTSLPPFVAVMPAVAVVWQMSGARIEDVLRRVNVPTLVFLFGVLLAVGALKEGGALAVAADDLPEGRRGALAVGLLSALVDNVPLVSAAVATFPLGAGADFWTSLAYSASVGGSLLVTGSAAGVVAMDEAGMTFGWFLRTMTLPVLVGAAAGWMLL